MGRPKGIARKTTQKTGWVKAGLFLEPEVHEALGILAVLGKTEMSLLANTALRQALSSTIENLPMLRAQFQLQPVSSLALSTQELTVTASQSPENSSGESPVIEEECREPEAEAAHIQSGEAQETEEAEGDVNLFQKLKESVEVHTADAVALELATVRLGRKSSERIPKAQVTEAVRDLRSWLDRGRIPAKESGSLDQAIANVKFDPFDLDLPTGK